TDILLAALPSERLEAIINVPKLLSVHRANISLALMNHVGEILIPSLSEFDMAVYHHREAGESYAWLLVLVGSLAFMLAFASGLTLYYRRRRELSKTNVYSGSGSFMDQPLDPGESALWIDRRWNGTDFEKDSNSSEKKLLNSNGTPANNFQEM
ncbi:Roundabout, partial [Caligus rogercresseyi]